MGFLIWAILGCCFIGLGVFSFFSKKPVGFWANSKKFEVNDIRRYNRAMGKLWCAFGIVFTVLGIPLLEGQDSPLILFSVMGLMWEVIVTMVVYTQIIEKKYRK